MNSQEKPPQEHCSVCGRPTKSFFFCEYHETALHNLRNAFVTWQGALSIDWATFLEIVQEADETGDWVLEVIEFIRSEDVPLELKQPPT